MLQGLRVLHSVEAASKPCDGSPRRALYDLIENVNEIRQDYNPELE